MISNEKYPKISIITPSFNQADFLEKTILSVLDQKYPNLEFMIIDGGSTDQSVEIIKRYESCLSFWVSEKDRGQTHAINKGFKRAKGVLVNWLNSDDMLAEDALFNLAHAFNKNPAADVFFGDYRAVDEKGRLLYQRKSAPYHPKVLFWGRQLSSQPSVFFKRNLLVELGSLDESRRFCMDTEFWIRAARAGGLFCQIKKELGITRVQAQAKTTLMQQVLHDEHKEIVRRYQALDNFLIQSRPEDFYFSLMNRFWRLNAAFRRLLFRKDFTFNRASSALKTISQEN